MTPLRAATEQVLALWRGDTTAPSLLLAEDRVDFGLGCFAAQPILDPMVYASWSGAELQHRLEDAIVGDISTMSLPPNITVTPRRGSYAIM